MVNIATYSLKLVKEKNARYEIEKTIKTPTDAYTLFKEVMDMESMSEEAFCIATLNIKNAVTGVFEVSRGTLNSSLVHPREVFKRAVANNAASVILAHNHPSGESTPSQEDINVTRRLVEAGKIIGIDVIDHIIIGSRYTSLKEKNLI